MSDGAQMTFTCPACGAATTHGVTPCAACGQALAWEEVAQSPPLSSQAQSVTPPSPTTPVAPRVTFPPRPKIHPLAIWAVIVSAVGMCCGPIAIGGIVMGIISRRKVTAAKGDWEGAGLSIGAVVLGIFAVGLWVVFAVLTQTNPEMFD